MPNRILKETICTSDTVDQLTWFEECFFSRLIVNCDDYGRMDARAAILKARLFPLKSVTEKQVSEALNKLSMVGIVTVYEYGGRPYLQLVTWEDHQTIRSKRSKYPAPPSNIPGPREHDLPLETDIEDMFFDFLTEKKEFNNDHLISIERQVRVKESYLDIVAKSSDGTYVFEIKRSRLSNKSIEQIRGYLALVGGFGVLVGCGISANFDIQMCCDNNIAVLVYDDVEFKTSILNQPEWLTCCEITLNHVKQRETKLVPNPNPNPNPNTNPNLKAHGGFDSFWLAYPKKKAKGDAEKAFNKIKPDDELLKTMLDAIDAQSRSPDWKKDGGQFIPYPATWLNQKRWEDEVTKGNRESFERPVQNYDHLAVNLFDE